MYKVPAHLFIINGHLCEIQSVIHCLLSFILTMTVHCFTRNYSLCYLVTDVWGQCQQTWISFLILKCCAFISVFATLPSHGGAFKVFLSHYKIAKLLFCIRSVDVLRYGASASAGGWKSGGIISKLTILCWVISLVGVWDLAAHEMSKVERSVVSSDGRDCSKHRERHDTPQRGVVWL